VLLKTDPTNHNLGVTLESLQCRGCFDSSLPIHDAGARQLPDFDGFMSSHLQSSCKKAGAKT
jgi:hypothetical protein